MANVSGDLQADWLGAAQLLQAGEYQQVADLLQMLQRSAQADNPLVTLLVDSVQQICLACAQCQADVEWHQHASEVATQREQQLRQHGQAILQRITGPAELLPSVTQGAAVAPHVGLRQRLQNLLGRGSRPVAAEQSKLALPVPAQFETFSSPETRQAELEPAAQTAPLAVAELATEAPLLTQAATLPPEAQAPAAESSTFTVEPTALTATAAVETLTEPGTPGLTVYCLGPFQVYQNDQPIADWVSGKGQAIFKYLVTHRERPVVKEVLMDLFWPEASAEAARNNLNVAISGLRRALRQQHPGFSHIVFQNDAYLLNPELGLWVDIEEFDHHYRAGLRQEAAGELTLAMQEYRTAEALCQGEFLADDRYEDWPRAQRQRLQDEYLDLLDRLSRYHLEQRQYDACLMMCSKVLGVDLCHEEAHRRLMRCYVRQGHHHLALRQYHLCVDALKRELDVEPDQATQDLYAQIRRRRPV